MPGGLPYQPWLAALVDERTANQAIDDPHIRCLPDTFLRAYGLPHYLKFVQTPDILVMLNEYNGIYRQVFTDGRSLPTEPNPSWQGYSIGTCGRTTRSSSTASAFVTTRGLIGMAASSPSAGQGSRAHPADPTSVISTSRVTVDDPKAYTKPWTVTLRQQFAADTELIDEICAEGEKFSQKVK